MLTSVVGTNWGDEGKGRMVDMLSDAYDVVVRYQGGNNAGHTVVNEYGKTVLNLLPSGIMRKNTANILGPGMVVDLEHLSKEIEALRKRGVPIGPENLILSSRATICLPYHRLLIIGCWMCWRRNASAAKALAPPGAGSLRCMRISI